VDGAARSHVQWLAPVEQRAWRAFVSVSSVVTAELEAELLAAHRLTLGEYGVLARLSEAPEQRLRMTDLASELHLSPSGLTRRLDRLVREGLVTRQDCPTDRRAVYAVLSPLGRTRLEQAAPDHVAGVRRLLIDRLDERQLLMLAEALEQVRAGCPSS
jgi:DNA-binding MarR family transcriptional regulator